MPKLFMSGLLLALSSLSVAGAPDGNHYYITGKIAEYTQAFDRCNQIAESRDLPSKEIITKLTDFTQRDIERLLMSKAALLRQECEKPELTELAYAILITENEELQQHTREAISAIKVLAFSGDIRKFQAIYQSVPAEIRQTLEDIGYFDRPFDDRKLLDAIRKKP
ncbi:MULTISPECIES: hypothetical protein [Marinobacter]|uniref:DUF4476 domain-containing protein n=1 Tax=Marinobacter metalliresistant TaxID=2961995 RepID=A0ABZ2VX92_9GAMM|nr:hypothetical protein [Marinobacter sp. Arc7-DN-1]AXS83597.1 hypothetical protein D0851_11445 [Marinobacter sp. Arc7-DN-1]